MAVFNTGTTGKIHIEDTGSWIHIYLEAGQSQTNSGSLGFSWSDPIGSGSSSISYPAGSGKKLAVSLGPFGPGQGGTIYFTLNYTGTQGFGGPTSVSMPFSRTPPATVPPAPTMLAPDQIGPTSMRVRFSGNGDGGSGMLGWELHWATNEAFTQGTGSIVSTGTSIMSDLLPGTEYWWKARGRNGVGLGPFSAPISARTLTGGRRKVAGVWRDVERWRKVGGTWRRVVRWRKVAGVWKRTR